MDVASAWLREHKPIDYIPGLMHGDYQFANVMYRTVRRPGWRPSSTGRWARSAIPSSTWPGWSRAGPTDTSAAEASEASYVDMRGMPNRDEVLAHYAEVSGRQVDDIDYYVILAKWKLAIVLEQGFQRAGDDPKLLAFGPVVLDLMKAAADLAETTDYGNDRRRTGARAAGQHPRRPAEPARGAQRAQRRRDPGDRRGDRRGRFGPRGPCRRPDRHGRPCLLRRHGPAGLRRRARDRAATPGDRTASAG